MAALCAESTRAPTTTLQLNVGLRYEYFPPLLGLYNISSSDPYGAFTRTAREDMFVADRNNWAPRLGLVYSPLGNKKLVFRAGASLGYIPQVPIYLMDMASIDPRLPLVADFAPADIPAASTVTVTFNQTALPSRSGRTYTS